MTELPKVLCRCLDPGEASAIFNPPILSLSRRLCQSRLCMSLRHLLAGYATLLIRHANILSLATEHMLSVWFWQGEQNLLRARQAYGKRVSMVTGNSVQDFYSRVASDEGLR